MKFGCVLGQWSANNGPAPVREGFGTGPRTFPDYMHENSGRQTPVKFVTGPFAFSQKML